MIHNHNSFSDWWHNFHISHIVWIGILTSVPLFMNLNWIVTHILLHCTKLQQVRGLLLLLTCLYLFMVPSTSQKHISIIDALSRILDKYFVFTHSKCWNAATVYFDVVALCGSMHPNSRPENISNFEFSRFNCQANKDKISRVVCLTISPNVIMWNWNRINQVLTSVISLVEKLNRSCWLSAMARVMNEDNSDTVSHTSSTPLVNRNNQTKVYKRRWYILLIFSLVAVLQGEMKTWLKIELWFVSIRFSP